MNYFDFDMSNSTNTVVYFDWKTVIYIYVCPIRADDNFYDGKVSRIDEASVTIILFLHVLIARRI